MIADYGGTIFAWLPWRDVLFVLLWRQAVPGLRHLNSEF
jgi:hypothetical protein